MKVIQNNLHYFNISKENPEKSLDNFYVFDKKHPELDKYIKNNQNNYWVNTSGFEKLVSDLR